MRVMIFDDDAELCEELAELLRSEGYEADYATDGFRAARLAFQKSYDLLLLDLEIPGVNRPELLKMFTRRNPLLKTCVITGNPYVRKHLEQENIYPYITEIIFKPLPPELLLDRLGALSAG